MEKNNGFDMQSIREYSLFYPKDNASLQRNLRENYTIFLCRIARGALMRPSAPNQYCGVMGTNASNAAQN
jgi:hypothetical protein